MPEIVCRAVFRNDLKVVAMVFLRFGGTIETLEGDGWSWAPLYVDIVGQEVDSKLELFTPYVGSEHRKFS